MKKKVKSFGQFIKESRDLDDPRNNGDRDPQKVVDSVLEIWMDSAIDEETGELVERYRSSGFDVLTLSQIMDARDIPSGSVVFTYEDDPSDLCYYMKGEKILVVTMGSLHGESLDEADGRLEELLGVEFGNDSYEDLIIAVFPAGELRRKRIMKDEDLMF